MIRNCILKNKKFIERYTYRKIMKKNREILQYKDESLEKQSKTIDLPDLEAELSKIKVIGCKRLEEIMTVI